MIKLGKIVIIVLASIGFLLLIVVLSKEEKFSGEKVVLMCTDRIKINPCSQTEVKYVDDIPVAYFIHPYKDQWRQDVLLQCQNPTNCVSDKGVSFTIKPLN